MTIVTELDPFTLDGVRVEDEVNIARFCFFLAVIYYSTQGFR